MKAMVSIPFKVSCLQATQKDLAAAFPSEPKMPAKLFDPMRADGTFPFAYVRSEHTNVAATIDRVMAELANGRRKL